MRFPRVRIFRVTLLYSGGTRREQVVRAYDSEHAERVAEEAARFTVNGRAVLLDAIALEV